MSWLARSLATSLNLPDDSGADDDPDADAGATPTPSPSTRIPPPPPHPPHSAAADGVKEDLTELSKTLTRQFWGVANFLAPPPGEASPSPSPQSVGGQSGDAGTPPEIAGIRNDFAEIGGKFRSGISRISSHKAVTGFSKMDSNFFAPEDDDEGEWEEERMRNARYEMGQEAARHDPEADEEWHQWEERVGLGVEDDRVGHELVDGHGIEMVVGKHEEDGELEVQRVRHDGGEFGVRHEEDFELEEQGVRHEEEEVEEDWDVIGITEEVLAFATNIARHPETWLDFPLLPDDDESDGPFSCNFSNSLFKLLFLGETICKVSSSSMDGVLLGSRHQLILFSAKLINSSSMLLMKLQLERE